MIEKAETHCHHMSTHCYRVRILRRLLVLSIHLLRRITHGDLVIVSIC